MMFETGLTPASLAGSLAYLATAGISAAAARGSGNGVSGRRWHWWMVALVFLGLAGWRIGLGEIRLQDDVREWARGRGLYEQRHTLQSLITLAVLGVCGAGVYVFSGKVRLTRSVLAMGAAIALVLFSLLRMLSLHQLDTLLFRTGPLHFNYVIDMGLTGGAALLAWLELRAAGHFGGSARKNGRRVAGRVES